MKYAFLPSCVNSVVTIHLGCLLKYYAHASMPASFLILPHRECDGTATEESIFASSGAAFQHGVDLYGNRTLKTMIVPGTNEFRYEAIMEISLTPEFALLQSCENSEAIPVDVLRYTLPSRYCEADKLHDFARDRFGYLPYGFTQAQAICDWVGQNFEYLHGSGSATLSACEAIQRGYGVCRDFAHIVIALCRALDLPARYVAAYIPIMHGNELDGENDIGIDFHAYAEVFLHGRWHVFDARYNQPLNGRIKIAHGMDAVDAAFATFYGNVKVMNFEVWARQIEQRPVAQGIRAITPAGKENEHEHAGRQPGF
jgi:transglutaminase-like putative cysteine protease